MGALAAAVSGAGTPSCSSSTASLSGVAASSRPVCVTRRPHVQIPRPSFARTKLVRMAKARSRRHVRTRVSAVYGAGDREHAGKRSSRLLAAIASAIIATGGLGVTGALAEKIPGIPDEPPPFGFGCCSFDPQDFEPRKPSWPFNTIKRDSGDAPNASSSSPAPTTSATVTQQAAAPTTSSGQSVGDVLGTLSMFISPALALASIVFSYAGQQNSLKLQRQLDAEKELRAISMSRKEEEDELLNRFRDPLLWATVDLQNRIYSIVEHRLLHTFFDTKPEAHQRYIVSYTLFLIGQLFGWMEIIRRDPRFLDLRRTVTKKESNLLFAKLLENVEYAFLSEEYDPLFLVYQGEQRGIGEIMLCNPQKEGAIASIMGFSQFVANMETDPQFGHWFARLKEDLMYTGKCVPEEQTKIRLNRLIHVQWALMEFLELLDPRAQVVPPERRIFVTEPEPLAQPVAEVTENISCEVPRSPTPTTDPALEVATLAEKASSLDVPGLSLNGHDIAVNGVHINGEQPTAADSAAAPEGWLQVGTFLGYTMDVLKCKPEELPQLPTINDTILKDEEEHRNELKELAQRCSGIVVEESSIFL
eukprot:jgi/Chlat1/4785/Chrsp31S04823